MHPRPSIGIIGLGLIGGSAAKAFSQAGYLVRGYDVNDDAMDAAFAEAVIANPGGDWREWAEDVDWLFVATPLAAVGSWLKRWAEAVKRTQLIIDVSSVKGVILPSLAALPGHLTPLCLHPMAGRELTGYDASSPELFRGHVCAVIPVPGRLGPPPSIVAEILGVLGMHGYGIDGQSHDQIAAVVSHLPYLVSAALLVTAERCGPARKQWERMTGSGFMDTSRVGSSSADLWQEILAANRQALVQVLDEFAQVLDGWKQDLQAEEPLRGLEQAVTVRRRVLEADTKHWTE